MSLGAAFPDKIFYVIGVDYVTQGLLAIVKNVLIHIEYALEKGYVPIVDMKNFSSQFEKEHSENAWELFFQQPMGYGLNDITNAKRIILSRNIDTWIGHSIYLSILDKENNDRHESLKKLYQQYIRPNEDFKKHIDSL